MMKWCVIENTESDTVDYYGRVLLVNVRTGKSTVLATGDEMYSLNSTTLTPEGFIVTTTSMAGAVVLVKLVASGLFTEQDIINYQPYHF